VYGWALNHLDGDYFQQQTPLVLPDNRYFPGQVDSAEAMLRLVFERTLGYA
ncbi:MAG: hypothetical protein GWN58_20825, partial [Anaerolineae bacterium]|nr:hypothetical protein [Anaerolineae bacterium]